MHITFLTPAYRDLEKIADYHMRMAGPHSAEKITDKLLDCIGVLESHPLSGTEHADPVLKKQDFRKLVCGDYVCIYKVLESTVFVYRVVHGATDYPRYFQERNGDVE
jgi:addiction module RelE/StbE family toxin